MPRATTSTGPGKDAGHAGDQLAAIRELSPADAEALLLEELAGTARRRS